MKPLIAAIPLILLANFAAAEQSPEARASELVAKMTLEEKAQQLGNAAPAIPRLGVPAYNWWNEGLHGVARAGIATVFPQAIGMAASWNTPLMHQVGDVIATEFRAKYLERVHPDGGTDWYRGLTIWSPNINIFRDPRWGRGQETYGEDPFLTGRIGVAFIEGLQGNDAKYFKTIATAKHFAVHSGPESNRHKEDVHPTPHDLEDTYLPAFRAAVTEAKVDSIMCAYNAVNGVPACGNDDVLNDHLRQAWGFKGFVVSDCGAAANFYREDSLRYTATAEQGVADAFKVGMDLICGDYRNNMTTEPEHIVAAVKQGLLPEAVVDQAAARLFAARIRLGLFDPRGSAFPKIGAKDYDTEAHHAVALEMARQSMVLLKNQDNLLPLASPPASIAVIGPDADNQDALLGNYNGTPSKPVTVLDGIRARFPSTKILYAEGSGLIGPALKPVPDSAFGAGLKMESFISRDLSGTPVDSQSANASLIWTDKERDGSTRWSGFITAKASGEHLFRFASNNGYRLWIGDQLIVDAWNIRNAPMLSPGRITLEAGHRYPLRLEAFQRGNAGRQELTWALASDTGEDAVEAARQADLVVFVAGLSARLEGEEMKVDAPGFAGGDRTSLDLPGPQQQLLERVQAVGKPVVLVLMSGSALSVNWADRNVPAIIEAWYPGGEGGKAVAELLAGDFSPAGRLPVTFYRSADQLPAFRDYAMKGRTYRYFDGEALYPFGFGLSYTSFAYSAPAVSAKSIGAGKSVRAMVRVSNSGGRDGDEVVQLYVAKPGDGAKPTLAGFTRVYLKKGESRKVSFDLDARALSQVDDAGARKVLPGSYRLSFGGGQPGHAQSVDVAFGVTGEQTLPK
jgi:beta-glucosidase